MRHLNKSLILIILTPFVFSFAFALDIYVPIIPQIQKIFHTQQSVVQLTLSLFIFANGVGELFMGPISDHLGRYKVILIAGSLFTLGGILSALSISINMLIIARIICALGASGLLVVSFAIIRDIYSGREAAMMFSFLNAAISISPTFAPIIGGYLDTSLGWRSVFGFIAVLGIVTVLISIVCVTETLPQHNRVKISSTVFKRYWQLFSNRQFLRYAIFSGLGVAICFSFFSVSPWVIIKLLHVSTDNFGFYFALFGLALAVGGAFSGKLVTYIGVDKVIYLGLALLFVGGAMMLVWEYYWHLTLLSFMSSTVIACIGAVFIIGSGAAGAMEPFADKAGLAAAGLGFSQFTISAVIGTTLMTFKIDASAPFAITVMCVCILGIINAFIFRSSTMQD